MTAYLRKTVIAAFLLALGVVFSALAHLLSIAGYIFLPLHIPVIICGFVCGKRYGVAVGFLLPFFSMAMTGMPMLYPMAITMSVELAAYGFFSGLLRKKLDYTPALVLAMLAGRVVNALANVFVLGIGGMMNLDGGEFVLSAFLTANFVTCAPGIIIQLALIPTVMFALKKSGYLEKVDAK